VGTRKVHLREELILAAFCLVMALGSLAAAGWFVISGQLSGQGVDGLFLVVVCLALAAGFSFVPATAVRQGLLRELRGAWKTKQAAPEENARSSQEAELAQKTSPSG